MMRTGDFKAIAAGAAGLILALAMSVSPAAAQSSDDCRCVDRDGNPIERCSCFKAPNFQGLVESFGFADARPRLGISVDVGQSARRDAAGALVTDVLPDGPADEAGIRRGDLITAIAGRSLFEPLTGDAEEDFDLDRSVPVQRLLAIAEDLEPGQEVAVEYERDGEGRSVTVRAEDLSAERGSGFSFAVPRFGSDEVRDQMRDLTREFRTFEYRSDGRSDIRDEQRSQERRARVRAPRADVRVFGGGAAPLVIDRYRGLMGGLELIALNPELGSYFGVEEGVLVADVDEDSTLGLQPGDVVLSVGDRAVTTPDRMRRILSSYAEDEEITLRVRRDGREITVTGTL